MVLLLFPPTWLFGGIAAGAGLIGVVLSTLPIWVFGIAIPNPFNILVPALYAIALIIAF